MNAITKSAKGEDCTIRIPGVCNFDAATTVLAHRNGGGMGGKTPDYQGAYACSACHDVYDRRVSHPDGMYVNACFADGVNRTQERLKEKGLIIIP